MCFLALSLYLIKGLILYVICHHIFYTRMVTIYFHFCRYLFDYIFILLVFYFGGPIPLTAFPFFVSLWFGQFHCHWINMLLLRIAFISFHTAFMAPILCRFLFRDDIVLILIFVCCSSNVAVAHSFCSFTHSRLENSSSLDVRCAPQYIINHMLMSVSVWATHHHHLLCISFEHAK